ncbi:flap endonuclease [Alkalihalophilus pseudofirmus]|uniref:5'-3' exonuclease n=1 Tax=Alkalihalobacterium alkalinitrilicum TaxID=427920 RepID=UPI00094D33D3|nr:5'-3' exonuclease H3TH domain-containing protein [Alkalihalobacterium alkalinitrilicum]OLO40489.1 flap endonuclease [Alkalihalophilus pseudofirmus]
MLVDGMALLFRGYYATAYRGYIMKTSSGVPTNGIYGFVKYMWDAIKTFEPSHVICCWDMGSKTFRTEMYPEYKANRGEPPEELIPQFDLVKEVVASFDIPNIGIEQFEADDCIGSLAKRYSNDMHVQILTGDHDSLQLVNERVHSIIMKKGMSNYAVYTPEKLLEEKGLTAAQMVDLKGLMGDTSDNFPGVKGIGEKTAIKLLKEYETIEAIIENLANLPKGMRTKIENELEMLHLSRKLAEIRCDVEIEFDFENALLTIDEEKVRQQFETLEFTRLLKEMGI